MEYFTCELYFEYDFEFGKLITEKVKDHVMPLT